MEAIDAVGAAAGTMTASSRDAIFARPVDLGEAVGAASALRAGQGGAARAGTGAAAVDAGARGARQGPRPHHRCRGAGPARRHRGAVRRDASSTRSSTAGRSGHRGAGLRQARHSVAALAAPRSPSRAGKRIPVRLVKGAYWDSEIKWAQERGLADYPVFSRKLHTDVSYLAAMRLLLSDPRSLLSAVCDPQRPHHRLGTRGGRRDRFRIPASARHGRSALRRRSVGRPQRRARAASTPPSAGTRICSAISSAACSKTAPTRRSSTASPTMKRRSPNIIADPVEKAERERVAGERTSLLARPRDIYSARSQEQRRARA